MTSELHDLTAYCPKYEHAMELLGKRWTGLVLRALMSGHTRFNAICNYVHTRVAEKSGFFSTVTSVNNGEAAAGLVLGRYADKPDVILLDLNMPLMNGFDFIRKVREHTGPDASTPAIVILTSSNDDRDLHMARALGVEYFLIKPLTAKDLHTTMFSILQRTGKPCLTHTWNTLQSL